MKFTAEIRMESAAFHPGGNPEEYDGRELAGILRKLADRVSESTFTAGDLGAWRLGDSNGAQVGEWILKESD